MRMLSARQHGIMQNYLGINSLIRSSKKRHATNHHSSGSTARACMCSATRMCRGSALASSGAAAGPANASRVCAGNAESATGSINFLARPRSRRAPSWPLRTWRSIPRISFPTRRALAPTTPLCARVARP